VSARDKSRIRSFRLKSDLLDKLDRATKRSRRTENALVSEALADRLMVDPLVPALQEIRMSGVLFQSIVNATSGDALELAASEMAHKNARLVRELYKSNDRPLDFQEFVKEILGGHGHWFFVEGSDVVNGNGLMLRHEYGLRWSRFVRSYLMSAYTVFSKNELKVEVDDQFVHLELPVSSNTNKH
jgi:hypothetical protein